MKPPTPATLRRYGLTLAAWTALVEAQRGACPICGREFGHRYQDARGKLGPPVRPVVDHEHVRGYAKLDPSERASRVRGIPCRGCNHRLLGRFVTLEKVRAVVRYLVHYRDGDTERTRADRSRDAAQLADETF